MTTFITLFFGAAMIAWARILSDGYRRQESAEWFVGNIAVFALLSISFTLGVLVLTVH